MLKHGKQNTEFAVTVGYYADGRVAEVFIDGAKSGTDMGAVTRDGAILLSLALQHGVALATIKHAITRNQRGEAETIVGAVVEALEKL
jgi:hypothetical protein